MDANIEYLLKRTELLGMDFDGIHTHRAHVWTDQDGREMVRTSRLDGLGLELLRKKTSVRTCVISKETNPVVSARCRKLQIQCAQSIESGEGKLEILERITESYGLRLAEVIYMGDDVNDIPVLRRVGMPVTVPDAHPLVKKICMYVTTSPGGDGAIREVCEMILQAKDVDLAI